MIIFPKIQDTGPKLFQVFFSNELQEDQPRTHLISSRKNGTIFEHRDTIIRFLITEDCSLLFSKLFFFTTRRKDRRQSDAFFHRFQRQPKTGPNSLFLTHSFLSSKPGGPCLKPFYGQIYDSQLIHSNSLSFSSPPSQ